MFFRALLLPLLALAADKEFPENGQSLNFIEENIVGLLRSSNYDLMYKVTSKQMDTCGCAFSPVQISFGSKVGLSCRRHWDDAAFDKETCGELCEDHHGVSITLFCPTGWNSNCQTGCTVPEKFDSIEDRTDFWDKQLSELIKNGYDYVPTEQKYLDECGCESKMRTIRYGTGIGFDCVMGKDAVKGERCNAQHLCRDKEERRLITFCPAGYLATCNGCVADLPGVKINSDGDAEMTIDLEDISLDERLAWMVTVLTGYSMEVQSLVGWRPTIREILGCACKDDLTPVPYGKRIGFSCPVHDAKLINNEICRSTVLCRDADGNDLLHLCPDGFISSCDEGCTYPWKEKNEL